MGAGSEIFQVIGRARLSSRSHLRSEAAGGRLEAAHQSALETSCQKITIVPPMLAKCMRVRTARKVTPVE